VSEAPESRDPDATKTALGGLRVLAAGARIADRYRVIGLTGVGAMGMVYRVHDERLHIDVALKVLRPEKTADTHMLERFEQELVLARQVTHRNVVRIHDIGQDGDLHFLTMDHVDGRSLKQVLDERGRVEVPEVVAIARDLADALGAAHAQSVVHRDLKPANVLVDREGRAYVTDFGVARSKHSAGLTQAGNIVGTLDYLAPEQARGGEVDGRTDIYSLGLMMFEMLTGERPFRAETVEESLAARSAGRLRRLTDIDVPVPRWLRLVVERCLEPDPAQRYQDAAALGADLAAGEVDRRVQLRSFVWPAAVTAVVVALAGTGWWYYSKRHAPVVVDTTPTLAVLPLAGLAGNDESAWLSTGLAEMLGQGLAESADLQVADSIRVLRTFEDLQLAPERLGYRELERLGELLDVQRLVTGTVREAGGMIRVELRVVDRRLPDEPPATLRAEARSAELFRLADHLTGELRIALAAAPAPPAMPSLSADGAAMAAYARGLDLRLKGDTAAAATAFDDAVAKDPTFASAWVQLALANDTLGYDDRALEAARQAVLHLSERSGRIGYEARALEASLAGNFDQSQQLLTALVARYPHDVEARVKLAEAYGEEGQLDRAREELKAIVAASPNHPRASYLLGKYAILAGDHRAAADDHLVRALVIQNRLGNLQGRADAENAIGIAQMELGRLDEARAHYQNAIDLRTRIGDERGVAAATANVARILLRQGKYDEARAGLQQSLGIVERIGNRQTVANLHNEIGALEERQGRYREALDRYRQSLAILRDLGDQRALAESYNNVGFTYYQLGDFDNAAVYVQQSMQLYERTENREGRMFAGQTVGLLALARGEWDAAEKSLLEVLQLGREFDDPLTQALALGQLGRAAQWQGNYGAAQASIQEGIIALEPSGDVRGLAELTLFQADLAFELGMLDAGREALTRAQALLDDSGSLEQRAEWWRLTAAGHLREMRPADARRAFGDARRRAGETGSAIARLATDLGFAQSQLAAGEPAEALAALVKLHGAARTLGHLPLILESGELLAHAQERAGRLKEAEEQLRASLRAADGHRPWAGRYRLHLRLAGILDKLDRKPEAVQQHRAAVTEIERLRNGLDASQRESFEQLEEVKQVAGSGIDQAA
jgi:eukaryotic-like serine/threonine-protein kinase